MEPLAYRMKPTKLEDFYGQEEIVGKDKLLYRLIKADKLTSAIFWGPPGCGKTSLARVIASSTKNKFVTLNATTSGVADIKAVVDEAQNIFTNPTGKVILFIDEIHRFNKLQQDALLPHVEKGTVILIGATTENPYFSVNKALISRSTIFKFKELQQGDVLKILENTIQDKENGLGNYNLDISREALEYIAMCSNGDVRTALNALELSVLTTDMNDEGKIVVDRDIAMNCVQQKKAVYDKTDDSHYDVISAFIKSMRGSDPDATLHYLARMLDAGEDPMFIARRIVIQSSEDVGLANSDALKVAVAAMQAVHQIGMPEARIILAQAALTVALSPKSNTSYRGINKAMEDVKTKDIGSVPMHIRNSVASGMEQFGYGEGKKNKNKNSTLSLDEPKKKKKASLSEEDLQGIDIVQRNREELEEERTKRINSKFERNASGKMLELPKVRYKISPKVIAIIVGIIIVITWLLYDFGPIFGIHIKPVSMKAEDNKIELVTKENDIYGEYNNELFVFSKNTITTYNEKCEVTWTHSFSDSFTPKIYVKGKYMLVTNNSTGTLYLFESSKEILNKKIDGTIKNVFLDKYGNMAVEYSAKSGYNNMITVFNKKGENRYDTYLSQEDIISLEMIDNAEKINELTIPHINLIRRS